MRSTPKCDIIIASSGGYVSMKTKIIYISGNEIFDMTDIRAAFDEVRITLGLDKNTVLFGVPVDNDDSLSAENNLEKSENEHIKQFSNQENLKNTAEELPQDNIIEPEIIEITEEKTKKSTAKKPRGRSVAKSVIEPTIEENVEEEQIIEETPNIPAEEPQKENEEEKIIPILSILAAKKDDTEQDLNSAYETIDSEVSDVKEPEITEQEEKQPESITADIDLNVELDVPATAEDESEIPAQRVTIEDMITEDAPSEPIEKTLEQLLESMTPLREDAVEEHSHNSPAKEVIDLEETVEDFSADAPDATLEQLAAEFAENEDKIPTETKTENHSKIGKLKNILPFKKAKRDDTGLMGDLFGWAGIAANDEEFSIPGFFTNAAQKK